MSPQVTSKEENTSLRTPINGNVIDVYGNQEIVENSPEVSAQENQMDTLKNLQSDSSSHEIQTSVSVFNKCRKIIEIQDIVPNKF